MIRGQSNDQMISELEYCYFETLSEFRDIDCESLLNF